MKLAVFHHSRLSMVDPPIDFNWASSILTEQMESLAKSGLLSACSELHLGITGCEPDVMFLSTVAPAKAVVIPHALDTCGELPTLCALQQWLPGHSDWGVLYFHTKGAVHNQNATYKAWRHCMEKVVIWNWRQCVRDLEAGFDCSGPHWLTPGAYPGLVVYPYYAGTFWWATGDYLATLPQLYPTGEPAGPSRYEAEVWIGRSHRKIKARKYAEHWPGGNCLKQL